MSQPTLFVIGATGAQGGAVARAALRNKVAVHALVRDPDSAASQDLKSQGVSLFKGDWDNILAIEAAAAGCTGLFLNVFPQIGDGEIRHARNILAASKRAGIKQVVYSSAIGVDRYKTFHNPDPASFFGHYFHSKGTIEEEVQNGDFETWTILRGVIFMTNFLLPASNFMFSGLPSAGRFVTGYSPDAKLPLVDPHDIGEFAFGAFSNPEKFGAKGIDIVAELLGPQEIIEKMEKVSGKKIETQFLTKQEIETQGNNPILLGQIMMSKPLPWLDLGETKAWGIQLHSFSQFLEKEKDHLQRSIGQAA